MRSGALILLLLLLGASEAALRLKRDGKLSTRWISRKGGIDVPITLRSLITCLTPGLNDLVCLGPRVGVAEPREITLTKKKGAAFGYNNGVDVRLLDPLNVPLIGDQTEIGHHIGATVAENAVEFGSQRRIFNLYKDNTGGVFEVDRHGVGVDVGYRGSAADDRVKLHYTLLGLTFGNPQGGIANPPLMPGSPYRAATNPYIQPQPGHRWETADEWYRSQFRNFGDEQKTPSQRACPWCFAAPN
ncbi:hypothetical protein QR680_013334 [Steinernema hermaphroditum]|uniref:Uncharacterized protein n=1 Tax=Steinernema hermaphroditum TaxID=289476 RepID=A0AA39I560_9BILA|nr:hypothetical protein QR680_013334 [Steinernema hermaphroditum]